MNFVLLIYENGSKIKLGVNVKEVILLRKYTLKSNILSVKWGNGQNSWVKS